jgi:hypothetical protein
MATFWAIFEAIWRFFSQKYPATLQESRRLSAIHNFLEFCDSRIFTENGGREGNVSELVSHDVTVTRGDFLKFF